MTDTLKHPGSSIEKPSSGWVETFKKKEAMTLPSWEACKSRRTQMRHEMADLTKTMSRVRDSMDVHVASKSIDSAEYRDLERALENLTTKKLAMQRYYDEL